MIKIAKEFQWTAITAIVLPLLVTGCAPQPLAPTVAYDHQGGKNIALLTPYIPPEETMLSIKPVTTAGAVLPEFGIIGGIIGGSIEQNAQNKRQANFTSLLNNHGFSAQTILTNAITRQLEAEGYTVSQISVARPSADFLKSYPQSQVPLLDVVLVQDGYCICAFENSYQPIIEMKYRLVAANGATTLAQGVFQYSSARGDQTPDSAYNYTTYSGFDASPQLAIKALTTVLTEAGTSTAEGLN